MLIRIHNDIKGELICNHPLISQEEAEKNFYKGEYISFSSNLKENIKLRI